MRPSEPYISLALALFLAVLWLGFLFHSDPRFAGTALGGTFAISGSLFLLVPLLYSLIKRTPTLKKVVTVKISFPTLLTIHIYSGFLGAILVLVHTGHKFQGVLATSLTGLLLIVVFSGYVGRYLLGQISKEVSEKKQLLSALETEYGKKVVELHDDPEQKIRLAPFAGFFSRFSVKGFPRTPAADVFSLAESIADVEYAVSTHDLFKRVFSIWLKLHIALSLLFYLLLTLHAGGAYYFGLRWFE